MASEDDDPGMFEVFTWPWKMLVLSLRLTIIFCLLSFGVWLYCRLTNRRCKCTTRLDGKTALVTGGSTGIGYETARALASRGARVIFTCRNMEVGRKALAAMTEASGNGDVVLKHLDLCSFGSVRRLAQDIIDTEPRLDILVNNAGRSAPPERTLTSDGFETTIQSNHLGPALFTALLLDLLRRSAPSRVVFVSSMVHAWSKLDVDDAFLQRRYSNSRVYGLSKLYNIYFARELSDKLRGQEVTVNVLHPGLVKSRFFRETPTTYFGKFLRYVIVPLFAKSPQEGAQTSIHLCLSPDLAHTSGRYFMECQETRPAAHAVDPVLQRRAWDITEQALEMRIAE
ncbi:hypothetical protein HPB48_012232 [Haemaphysalis longicornis]|uniref:Dehydrogenase with different specificities related to short-chain alcohol dehydrogenase n=1 Tax=Haemaphysalis longicornis TaxID=44386 RepID=A0A9J6GM28_HAELO|nr:hypothetical protein HPB48_012232 [Haemaphysalis longicornis]